MQPRQNHRPIPALKKIESLQDRDDVHIPYIHAHVHGSQRGGMLYTLRRSTVVHKIKFQREAPLLTSQVRRHSTLLWQHVHADGMHSCTNQHTIS